MQQKTRRLLSLRGTFAHVYCAFGSSSSIRTVTVGPGLDGEAIITGSTTGVARGLDESLTHLTAGRGFHPAPKMVHSIVNDNSDDIIAVRGAVSSNRWASRVTGAFEGSRSRGRYTATALAVLRE
jgi:hypothetical protein